MSESKRKILLLSNLPQRDLETDTILQRELVSLGFEVRLAEFLPKAREHVLYYKPDIVIGPEARCEYTIDFYKRCREWGIITVAKRTEGGAAQRAWDVMEQWEKDTVIGGWPYSVDLELVWSQEFADLMEKHGYLTKESIYATGALPMDVYFLPPKPERVPGRRNIILATGWGHADRTPSYNVPEAPPDSPIHQDAYNRHRAGRDAWMEMIEKLHYSIPEEWELILRLKVGEYPNEYAEKFGDKIKIAGPCSTRTILTHADLLIHAGSTMAIEAHLMNVPAISFWGMQNQTVGYEYPHVSEDYTDADNLVEAVKRVDFDKSNANLDAVKSLEQEFYGVIDGKACERAAKRISIIPPKTCNVPYKWPEEDKEYSFPGVARGYICWVCESCGKSMYTLDPSLDMVKCLFCGISLAKRQ